MTRYTNPETQIDLYQHRQTGELFAVQGQNMAVDIYFRDIPDALAGDYNFDAMAEDFSDTNTWRWISAEEAADLIAQVKEDR